MIKDTLSIESLKVIFSESESIISTIEDFISDNEENSSVDELNDIRYYAERMQILSNDASYENDIFDNDSALYIELENLSVELYQSIKYTLDYLIDELELFSYDTVEFEYLRTSINTIRSLFV